MVWHFFDSIICINLKSRPDRLQYAENIFKELNIPVQFFIVTKSPKGGIYGCFDSHIKIINYMKETGKNNVLVFEDDIFPTISYNIENIKNAIQFMKTNLTWDLFYLGFFTTNYHNLFITAPTVNNHIVKYRPLGTHAYCINQRAVNKILSSYEQYINIPINIDEYYAENTNLNSYCYIPILFDQHLCYPNDIEPGKKLIEYIARKSQCAVEKSNIFWTQSIIKYYIITYQRIYLLITILIFINIIFIIFLK